MGKSLLFEDFPKISTKAWKQKIQYDLKGADYNDALVWESPEGIKVKPFYNVEDRAAGPELLLQPKAEWKIGQSIYAGNATMANAKAKESLQKGVESLVFNIPSDAIKIEALLMGIDLEKIPIHFELQFLDTDFVKSIVKYEGESKNNIHINADIIGNLARTGNWFFDLGKDHGLLEGIIDLNMPNSLSIDVSLYQNAGANRVQQLAYGLAHANEYLNHFAQTKSGNKRHQITFKVAIGSNYFFEIAKLRAMRLLFDALAAEYDFELDMHILAVPTKRNKTLYDYNVNMLRTTTECMAAVLGGADTIVNLPYDAIYHKDNDFGERIAINQLLLLKNESYFDRVGNPSDGSYYIESLTQQLAEKALLFFKSIESGGGFLKLLKDHTIQRKISESAQKEQDKFDAQTTILVGTNKYQNPKDKMKDDLELFPFVKTKARKTLIIPILEKRLSEALEQKRLDDE